MSIGSAGAELEGQFLLHPHPTPIRSNRYRAIARTLFLGHLLVTWARTNSFHPQTYAKFLADQPLRSCRISAQWTQSFRWWALTRGGPGGGGLNTPFRFFVDISKTAALHFFRTRENFRPRSLKVRSPGHVKWPYLRKMNVCHSYAEWPITSNLSAIDIRNSRYLWNVYLGILISVTQGQVNFATSLL